MELRIALTNEEANKLSEQLVFKSTGYVKDVYTGKKRIRTDESSKVREKEYITPVKGVVHRFSSSCSLGDITGVWFEFKWTKNKQCFEIEFEGNIPEEFQGRPGITGWDILKEKPAN